MTTIEKDISAPGELSSAYQKGLRVTRLLYFFYFAAFGITVNYLNVYFHEIGLSGTQIGMINSIAPLMAMIGGPIWGLLSDRFGAVRLLFAATGAGAILSILALSTARSFLWILPLTALYIFFFSPIIPLLDSTTLRILGDRHEFYGRQRIFGSFGFIVTALGFGIILERIGLQRLFYGFAVAMLPFILAALWLPEDGRSQVRVGLRRGLLELIRLPAWQIFSASLIVLGIAYTGMVNFLGVYIKELGGGEGLIGAATSLGALSELPIMFLGGSLTRRIGSRRMLGIATCAYIVRWLLYALMPAPEWALVIGLLNGVTFGLFWIASVAYANEIASDSLKATAQGLLGATLSLTHVLGAPLGGILFDTVGPSSMFYIYTGFGLVALALIVWAGKLAGRERTVGSEQ